ncbi:MAG: hypothetical protein ACK5MB_06240 [Phycisphaerales bacterium]
MDAQLAAYLRGEVAAVLGRTVTLKGRIASGRMNIEQGTIGGTDVSLSVQAVRGEESLIYAGGGMGGASRRSSTIEYTVLLADLNQDGTQYRPERGWTLIDGDITRHIADARSVSDGKFLVLSTTGPKAG